MFEYLMPLLFTRTHEDSLLDRACHDAVHCQIAYGRQNQCAMGNFGIGLQRGRPESTFINTAPSACRRWL